MRHSIFFLGIVTALAARCMAQPVHPPSLVMDYTQPHSEILSGSFLGVLGGAGYVSSASSIGRQIWKTDGTAEGTLMLREFGSGSSDSVDRVLGEAGGLWYFPCTLDVTMDGTPPPTLGLVHYLGRSDGTLAGTQLIKEFGKAEGVGRGAEYQGQLYFFRTTAGYPDDGVELWRSDGTGAGTESVKALYAGGAGTWLQADQKPAAFVLNGKLLAFAPTPRTGNWTRCGMALWSSDGTSAGTILIKEFGGSGLQDNNIRFDPLVQTSHELFFAAADNDTNGKELWATDGTLEGTRMVKDIETGTASGLSLGLNQIQYAIALGDKVYFNAKTAAAGLELWVSDSTEAGTHIVTDLNPGTTSSQPSCLTVRNGDGYFLANQFELWRIDGASGALTKITTFPHVCPSGLYRPTMANSAGTLFINLPYYAGTGTLHHTIWKSDGTAAGTVKVTDIDPTGSLRPLNDKVLFTIIRDEDQIMETWSCDGTASGTQKILTRQVTGNTDFTEFAPLGNSLYAGVDTHLSAVDLIRSNGTAAGTSLVASSLNQNYIWGPYPLNLTPCGDGVYYCFVREVVTLSAPPQPRFYYEIGKADQSGAHTLATTWIEPKNFISHNGFIYFAKDGTVPGLWRTSGQSPTKVCDIPGYAGGEMRHSGGKIYYQGNMGDAMAPNTELSAASLAGGNGATVKDICAGTTSSNPRLFTDVNGTLFFIADDGVHGTELWKSNGTEAGTMMIKDIAAGAAGSSPADFLAVNGTLYFSAADGAHGRELWKSDGTPAGTMMIKDVAGGTGDSDPQYLCDVGGTIYFSAFTPQYGLELWKTDGTEAGTVMVKDIDPGTEGSTPQYLAGANGWLYFAAYEPEHGSEIWASDGTGAGTKRVTDISPGAMNSYPARLTLAGDNLFFTANDGTTDAGIELWVMNLSSHNAVRCWREY